jgi:undecaprenyl-diphosphatase
LVLDLNAFDTGIIEFLNRFSQRSHVFDTGVGFLEGHDLLKGGVFMALLWWAWARRGTRSAAEQRSYLISALVMGAVAVLLARVLALSLPFRDRPVYTPGFAFTPPYGPGPQSAESWSSFPSDHAALFFALATGLFFSCRRLGLFALFYAAFGICLPRLYLGEHWPTDILGGAAIGAALGWLGARERVRTLISRPALRWHDREPGAFYAAMFLLTYQTATLFVESRAVVRFAIDALQDLL